MKKRTFLAITASVVFAATITSCGGEAEKVEAVAEDLVTVVEETVEETVEEVVEEAASLDGAEFFTTSGCVACHQADTKTVGPALTAISAAYADNKDGLLAFMKGEGEAIVDPAMEAVMAPQVEITKAMTDEEREALASHILNN